MEKVEWEPVPKGSRIVITDDCPVICLRVKNENDRRQYLKSNPVTLCGIEGEIELHSNNGDIGLASYNIRDSQLLITCDIAGCEYVLYDKKDEGNIKFTTGNKRIKHKKDSYPIKLDL